MFGSCVHSLRAPLPYAYNARPPAADAAAAQDGSAAEKFAQAFARAQHAISRRIRLGTIWPLWEILEDQTDALMRTVDAFLDPIIQEALTKQEARVRDGRGKRMEAEESDDEITLLDHLVGYTTGKRCYL